jgi:hypothetical protein
MTTIELLKKYLSEDEWNYSVLDSNVLGVSIRGDHSTYDISIRLENENSTLLLNCNYCILIGNSMGKKAQILEILNDVNDNSLYTKFYLTDKKNLVCSVEIELSNTLLGSEAFLISLHTISNNIDEVYPKIMKFIWAS